MSLRHFPRRGDKVNDVSRAPNGNGFVIRVLYNDGPDEVMVRFDDGVHYYDFSEFQYSWTDGYGGVFIVQNARTG